MNNKIEKFLEKWYLMGELMKDGKITGITPNGVVEIGIVLTTLIDIVDNLESGVSQYERNVGTN